MSKMRILLSGLILLSLIVCFFSSLGVKAEWLYNEALAGNIDLDIDFIVMPWVGADELPNQSDKGNNHKTLIQNILNGTYLSGGVEQGIGLNTDGSYIADQIKQRQSITWRDANQIGSMDVWQDDKLAEYFDLHEESNKVAFILEFPDGSNDTYYLYTTSVELGSGWSPNIPTGTNVYPVYKTVLQKDAQGKWQAVSTEIGYAPSALYKNPITGLSLGPAFNTAGWKAGKLGTGFDNAVYTAVGLTLPVETHESSDVTYYSFSSTSNATRTVTVSDSENAVVYVYQSNGTLVSASRGAQGSQTISFSAKRNTTYYIMITGDTFCTFKVS